MNNNNKRDYEEDVEMLVLALQDKPGRYLRRKDLAPILGVTERSSTLTKIIKLGMEKHRQIRKNPDAKAGGFCWFGSVPKEDTKEKEDAKTDTDTEKKVSSVVKEPEKEVKVSSKKEAEKPEDPQVEFNKARTNASGAADPTAYRAIGHDKPMCGEVWRGTDKNGTWYFLVANVYDKTYVCFRLDTIPSLGNARGLFSVDIKINERTVKYYGNANIPVPKHRSSLNTRVMELSIEELTKVRASIAQAFRINADLTLATELSEDEKVKIVEVEKEIPVEVPVEVEKIVKVPTLDEKTKAKIEILEYKVKFLEDMVNKLLSR